MTLSEPPTTRMPRRMPPSPRPGPALRILLATPFLGRMIRDIEREPDSIWYALVILLTALVLGVHVWGVMALTVAALAAVPAMFFLLILVTLG